MSNARLTNVIIPFPVIKSERFPVKINICVSYFMIYTCTISFHTAYQKKKNIKEKTLIVSLYFHFELDITMVTS